MPCLTFEPDPDQISLWLVEITARMESLREKGCKREEHARAKHILRIVNENSNAVKQRFVIRYSTDVPGALICDGESPAQCTGGSTEAVVEYPSLSGYWAGPEKGLVRSVCVVRRREHPDFNVRADIECLVYRGSPPYAEEPDLTEHVSLSVHGRWGS